LNKKKAADFADARGFNSIQNNPRTSAQSAAKKKSKAAREERDKKTPAPRWQAGHFKRSMPDPMMIYRLSRSANSAQ
jgi:hypothetical protein